MVPPGTTWRNPRTGATLTVVEDTPARAVIERRMAPHTGRTDPHVHRDFDQEWEVLDGEMRCTIAGEDLRLRAGDRAAVRRGTPHRDAWNDADDDLVVRLTIEPSSRFIEVFARTLGGLMERDAVNAQGEFTQLQLFAVLRAGRADSWAPGIPVAVQKPVVVLGAALARVRGHRAVTGP